MLNVKILLDAIHKAIPITKPDRYHTIIVRDGQLQLFIQVEGGSWIYNFDDEDMAMRGLDLATKITERFQMDSLQLGDYTRLGFDVLQSQACYGGCGQTWATIGESKVELGAAIDHEDKTITATGWWCPQCSKSKSKEN